MGNSCCPRTAVVNQHKHNVALDVSNNIQTLVLNKNISEITLKYEQYLMYCYTEEYDKLANDQYHMLLLLFEKSMNYLYQTKYKTCLTLTRDGLKVLINYKEFDMIVQSDLGCSELFRSEHKHELYNFESGLNWLLATSDNTRNFLMNDSNARKILTTTQKGMQMLLFSEYYAELYSIEKSKKWLMNYYASNTDVAESNLDHINYIVNSHSKKYFKSNFFDNIFPINKDAFHGSLCDKMPIGKMLLVRDNYGEFLLTTLDGVLYLMDNHHIDILKTNTILFVNYIVKYIKYELFDDNLISFTISKIVNSELFNWDEKLMTNDVRAKCITHDNNSKYYNTRDTYVSNWKVICALFHVLNKKNQLILLAKHKCFWHAFINNNTKEDMLSDTYDGCIYLMQLKQKKYFDILLNCELGKKTLTCNLEGCMYLLQYSEYDDLLSSCEQGRKALLATKKGREILLKTEEGKYELFNSYGGRNLLYANDEQFYLEKQREFLMKKQIIKSIELSCPLCRQNIASYVVTGVDKDICCVCMKNNTNCKLDNCIHKFCEKCVCDMNDSKISLTAENSLNIKKAK